MMADVLNFVISLKGDCCDCSPWETRNLYIYASDWSSFVLHL